MFQTYKDIFSLRANSYHQAMLDCPRARDSEFRAVLSQYAPAAGDTVCDIPAGGGYFWNYLKDSNCQYMAVETSKYFYDNCPINAQQQRLLCDMHQIELPDSSIDVLYCITGLHHIENRHQVYQEFFRLLKPQSYCVIAEVAAGSAVDRFLNQFVDQHNSMGHKGEFIDEHDLAAMLSCGFYVKSDIDLDYDWEFSSIDEMNHYCKLLFGLDQATDEQIESGIRDILTYDNDKKVVQMRWGLRFITLQKP